MSSNLKLLIALLPFVEIALLAKLVSAFGFFVTLGFLLLSASTGLTIVRLRGLSALLGARESLQRGKPLADTLYRDAISALGGVFLIIPGPFTDVVGILMQIPFFQDLIGRRLLEKLSSQGNFHVYARSDSVIEGDFRREQPREQTGKQADIQNQQTTKGNIYDHSDRPDNS